MVAAGGAGGYLTPKGDRGCAGGTADRDAGIGAGTGDAAGVKAQEGRAGCCTLDNRTEYPAQDRKACKGLFADAHAEKYPQCGGGGHRQPDPRSRQLCGECRFPRFDGWGTGQWRGGDPAAGEYAKAIAVWTLYRCGAAHTEDD